MNDPFQKKRPSDNWEALANDLLGSDGGLSSAPIDDDPLDLDGLDVEPEPVAPPAAPTLEALVEPEATLIDDEEEFVDDEPAGGDDDFGFGLLDSEPKPKRKKPRPVEAVREEAPAPRAERPRSERPRSERPRPERPRREPAPAAPDEPEALEPAPGRKIQLRISSGAPWKGGTGRNPPATVLPDAAVIATPGTVIVTGAGWPWARSRPRGSSSGAKFGGAGGRSPAPGTPTA